MPSSSSGSSSESSSAAAPTRKRKQVEDETSEGSEGHDSTDASDADEGDSDAPQPPLPSADVVLSHAERRRQKKRQKRDQLTTSSPSKKRKLDDTSTSPPSNVGHANSNSKAKAKGESTTKVTPTGDDPRRQKRQNSVWVGNLSFRTTQDALRGFFDGAGTITRVHMPMRRGQQIQGENMGCVLLSFLPSFPFCTPFFACCTVYTYCMNGAV